MKQVMTAKSSLKIKKLRLVFGILAITGSAFYILPNRLALLMPISELRLIHRTTFKWNAGMHFPQKSGC
jgi:hypothetical protein